MEWQPIETAPKDGQIVILTDGKNVEAGCWCPSLHGEKYPWAFVDDYTAQDIGWESVGVVVNAFDVSCVTHWMPLPTPPAKQE